MSTEDNKAIVRSFVDEVLNKRDSSAIDRIFAVDFVYTRWDQGVFQQVFYSLS